MPAPARRGRPPKAFTPEMIDAAKQALGRQVYPSRAADELRRTFGLGRDKAYELLAVARSQVADDLTRNGSDPLTGVYLFLQAVMADPAVRTAHRIAAALATIKLLGLSRILPPSDKTDVDEYLARLAAAHFARSGGIGG